MREAGYIDFRWQGESIADIWQWAKDRGEAMVVIRCEPDPYPNALTGRLIHPEPYEQIMPESFWNSFMWTKAKMSEVRRYHQ